MQTSGLSLLEPEAGCMEGSLWPAFLLPEPHPRVYRLRGFPIISRLAFNNRLTIIVIKLTVINFVLAEAHYCVGCNTLWYLNIHDRWVVSTCLLKRLSESISSSQGDLSPGLPWIMLLVMTQASCPGAHFGMCCRCRIYHRLLHFKFLLFAGLGEKQPLL